MPLRGFVANTDYDWYRYLSGQPDLAEVNFWQPSRGRPIRTIERFEPFFFKLKRPHNAVAGFGLFDRRIELPAWRAWECFGEANGAADFASMRRRVERLRHSSDIDPGGNYLIGCLIVSEPIFFPEALWIRQPGDWKPNIEQGKTYELWHGEGLSLWQACRDRVLARPEATVPGLTSLARHGSPYLVHPRRGQGTFRIDVAEAYEGACAVTGEHTLPALEAAHIKPYAEGGEHSLANGVLLRSDIHRLFDRGYVTITPEHRFEVSRRLKDDFDNGRSYNGLHGTAIHLPPRSGDHPDPALLDWHARARYLG